MPHSFTMPTISSSVLLTAGLAGLAAAAPSAPVPKVGTFSVNQVRNPGYVAHGPYQLAKTYLKYGATLPPSLSKIMADIKLKKRSTGTAKAVPEQYDIQYLTPVNIGTPAQKLNLDFDSGSSDLWVFSTDTPSSQVNGQAQYDPSKSSTAKKMSGATWSITYGDGSASAGYVYTDVVNVGGISFDSQAVETATKVSSSFSRDSNNDGLLGLAFSQLNAVEPKSQKTWFDNLKESLDDAVWTADLKASKPGTYNFGYIDDKLYTGEISYVDVDTTNGFWQFDASGYSIGNSSERSDSSSSSTAINGIADTGTTLAMLPASVCKTYYKQVKGSKIDQEQGGYVFPCDSELPDFTYVVGDAKITVPGSFINYAPVDETSASCFGGLQPDTSIGFSIWGDVALKAAFVVFEDKGSSPRLGFASKDL